MNYLRSLATTAGSSVAAMWQKLMPSAARQAGERGDRLASDKALLRDMANQMFIDYERRAMVALMREMDIKDGRIKRVHRRVARDVVRGGLVMQYREGGSSETLRREWEAFAPRLQLNRPEKLRSDALGLVMEGNLPLQLVLSEGRDITAAIRMPSDTIVPMVDLGGRFKDPGRAFEQRDVMTGKVLASFPAWQMALCRLDPDNFDDLGSMGRPLLDSCAATWRKLVMTEEDLVIRRRVRAPLRLAHILEGADEAALASYRQSTEGEKGEITTDFYLNRKGGVQAIQGDASLGDIGDVVHLLDTFFSGAPAPKGLFGYTDGMQRDILEDLKRDYYDEVDGLQDLVAGAYLFAFRIHLLFKGMDPAPDELALRFAERRTETPNQVADLALKYMALHFPDDLIYSEMGFDAERVREMKVAQAKRNDPYPNPLKVGPDGQPLAPAGGSKVSITPGNARKGESGTAVSNPGGNGGRGR